jgi:hypothetical protein
VIMRFIVKLVVFVTFFSTTGCNSMNDDSHPSSKSQINISVAALRDTILTHNGQVKCRITGLESRKQWIPGRHGGGMPGVNVPVTLLRFSVEETISGPADFAKGSTGYFLTPLTPTELKTGDEVTLNYYLCPKMQMREASPSERLRPRVAWFPEEVDYVFVLGDGYIDPTTYFSLSSGHTKNIAEQSPGGDVQKAAKNASTIKSLPKCSNNSFY